MILIYNFAKLHLIFYLRVIFYNNKMEYEYNGFIYKGVKNLNRESKLILERESPTWFALNEDTIKKYGELIYKFKIIDPLKLLNITTWEFRNDFLNRLNKYPDILKDSKLKYLKALSLIALGLPNFNTQLELMKKYLQNIPRMYNDDNLFLDTCTYIGHRLSEKTIDLKMVELLQLLYGTEYQGYIQPMKIASFWMNEFAEEICIFNLKNLNGKLNNVTSGGKKNKNIKQHGGSETWEHKMNDTMCDDEKIYLDNFKIYQNIFLKYDGYNNNQINKFLQNNNIPSFNERMQNRLVNNSIIDIPSNLKIDFEKINIETDNEIKLKVI